MFQRCTEHSLSPHSCRTYTHTFYKDYKRAAPASGFVNVVYELLGFLPTEIALKVIGASFCYNICPIVHTTHSRLRKLASLYYKVL